MNYASSHALLKVLALISFRGGAIRKGKIDASRPPPHYAVVCTLEIFGPGLAAWSAPEEVIQRCANA